LGQWVKVHVLLGVPAACDGTGDYPLAHVEVFAVDQPADFEGGVFGIGFAIGGLARSSAFGLADGGPARNPLLHLFYQEARLSHGYVVSTQGIDVGLTSLNTQGFTFIALDHDASDEDWLQPLGSLSLAGDFSGGGFSADLPFRMDTGLTDMTLLVSADQAPPNLPSDSAFPAGIEAIISPC
jgi:hypothetical protein